MTDKKVTPIQVARRWAREHPDATGCIAVQYLVPKGRGGRRGTGFRRDHYLVEAGQAAKLASRTVPRPDGPALKEFNGYCYRCGSLFLEPVLRVCYVANPLAGELVANSYAPDVVYADLGSAALCPACAEEDGAFGWHDGAMPPMQAKRDVTWLGGGDGDCKRRPLEVLLLED